MLTQLAPLETETLNSFIRQVSRWGEPNRQGHLIFVSLCAHRMFAIGQNPIPDENSFSLPCILVIELLDI